MRRRMDGCLADEEFTGAPAAAADEIEIEERTCSSLELFRVDELGRDREMGVARGLAARLPTMRSSSMPRTCRRRRSMS